MNGRVFGGQVTSSGPLRYNGPMRIEVEGRDLSGFPATEDDIFYCYRLVLGREPDQNGFDNYSAVIKTRHTSITDLFRMFLTSAEFKNRNLLPKEDGAEPVLAELPSFRLYVSPSDWAVGKPILESRVHEPHVTGILKHILAPGMTLLDIGANIGYFTMLARSIVGQTGKVWAFEPNPLNCTLLHLSLAANSFQDVEIFPFALADSPRLFVYDAQGSNGTITPYGGDPAALSARTVIRSVVLDDVLRPDRCDVLKIDVEGAEFLALQGGVNLIRTHHPVIFTEFSPPALRNVSGVSGEQYLQFLFSEGYRVNVINATSALVECGDDSGKVMKHFENAHVSHIDLLAIPTGFDRNTLAFTQAR